MTLRAGAQRAMRELRYGISDRLDARWNNDPLAKGPTATEEEFRSLAAEAAQRHYPEVDRIEAETGFAVEKDWLDGLALHTQIVKKRSTLGYPHGRLLYTLLRRYMAEAAPRFVTVLETGTARGFSALCMAKAITDAGVNGRIVTIDRLPHHKPIFWNCIDDLEGRKSRHELLEPWSDLLDLMTFIQGDTLEQLGKVGLNRVHFAFLDAQHSTSSVLHEYGLVRPLQQPGDMLFFDDVTPGLFGGVVEAVADIEAQGSYSMRRLIAAEERGFAWGRRL